MKRYRLILLILALTISPFVFNNCTKSLGEKLNDKDSQSINFQLFHEKFESNQNLRVLDTRTIDEYKTGHIPGALILPVQDLESSKDVSSTLSKFNKDGEIYIYCTAGGPRSQRATQILRTLGFNKAYFVEGGIAKWITTGNPLE